MDAGAAVYRIHRYPSALIDRLTLEDGRMVTVRPVLPQDAQAQSEFVASLSPQAKHRRFLATVRELPDAVLRSLTEIDYRSHLAIVAEWACGCEDPCIVADARYVIEPGGERAEFAVVVADAWQGVGLGGTLIGRLVAEARRRGLKRLHGDVLATNAPMIGLVQRHGGRISPHLEDSSLVRATFLL
jgi:acetyltransferase